MRRADIDDMDEYPEFEEPVPYCRPERSEPSEIDMPERYQYLDPEEREILRKWIGANVAPMRRIPTGGKGPKDSYCLKHRFEKFPEGFYVDNGTFKGAMLDAGYKPVDAKEKNWRFRAKYIGPTIRELEEKRHAS